MLTILVAIWAGGLMLYGLLTVAEWLYRWAWAPSPEQELPTETETETTGQPLHQRRNGHSPYSRTWPATRTRPWQRRVR